MSKVKIKDLDVRVKSFLGERRKKIENYTRLLKNLYLVSGCGTGKSYLVEKMMKHNTVLNVNFLNVLNLQNFSDTYKEGRKNAEDWDGSSSLTINVENLKYISDAALKKCNYVVIDEIQKLWQDDYRKTSCGDKLVEQIKRIQSLKVPVLIMTGTPICGLNFRKELGFSRLTVEKENLTEKDKYEFTFVKNLTPFNVAKYVKKLEESGETVVILSNLHRKVIGKHLVQEGINYEDVFSDDKNIDGTSTKYIVDNMKLPETANVFLSTSVLQEGVNLKDDPERPITFISFIDDIKTPNIAIQFAGRAREQKKKLVLGYRDEKDFCIENSTSFYTNAVTAPKSFLDYAKANYENFQSKEDWINYFKALIDPDYLEVLENSCSLESTREKEDCDSCGECKEIVDAILTGEKLCSTYSDSFKVHGKGTLEGWSIIPNPNAKGENMWIKTGCARLVKNLIKALDFGFDTRDFSSDEMKTLSDLISFSRTFYNICIKNPNNISEGSTLLEDLLCNKFSGIRLKEEYRNVFKNAFSVSKYKNGTLEALADKSTTKRMVDRPLELLLNFPDTLVDIIRLQFRDMSSDFIVVCDNPFIVGETIMDKFKREFSTVTNSMKQKKASAGAKGGKATKKVVLENVKTGEKIEFNSSKECDEYVRSLGFSLREMKALRNSEVKGYKRV